VRDILRIKQVVSNFLSNAIKFTHNGGKIIVEAQYSDPILKISVIDNGIGIKKRKLKNIFQAFTQVQENSALYGGTGLGLSISYQLAKPYEWRHKSPIQYQKGKWFYHLKVPGTKLVTNPFEETVLKKATKQKNIPRGENLGGKGGL